MATTLLLRDVPLSDILSISNEIFLEDLLKDEIITFCNTWFTGHGFL